MTSFTKFKVLLTATLIYFSGTGAGLCQDLPKDLATGALELRNYRLKPGKRDEFIAYFKAHFVASQNKAGSQILGIYRVKGAGNNFFWLRGFTSLAARKVYLPAFYYGTVWKTFGHGANDMLSNNDDVHLLKPLTWNDDSPYSTERVHINIDENNEGITVITFYTCNTKLDKMIDFVGKTYLPVFKTLNSRQVSFWISELAENDFPKLPVFQDKDLMVSIAHYKNETEFKKISGQILQSMSAAQKDEFDDIVTKTELLILYPVKN